MKNIDELIELEADLYHDIRGGTVDLAAAVELNNAAGKIVSACKVKLLYAALRDRAAVEEIPFLESAPPKRALPARLARRNGSAGRHNAKSAS